MLVPPLYYSSQDPAKKTMITPIYARSKMLTDDAYWSALMPFYYRDGDKDSSRTITLAGAWIGLNTAKIDNSQGIGFTVPSSQVREFLGNVLAGNGQPVE